MSAWAVVVYIVGSQRGRSDLTASGDRAIHVVAATTLIAMLVLLAGLLRHDFSMRYVATYSSINLPRPYLVSALWSGQRGSLLLAAVFLSALSVAVIAGRPRVTHRVHETMLSLVLVVALAALCLGLDPLGGLNWVPVDGIGMRPALQSPAAVLFPPMLIAAYATYVVAGTRALEAILAGSIDRAGIDAITRWSVAAWALNTLGLVAGTWWAYRAPGRASAWTMFPVETGAILPWLAVTTFLGTLMITNGRRPMPGWSFSLVAGAMLLAGPSAALTTATVAGGAASAARSGFFIAACVAVAAAIGACAFLAQKRVNTMPVAARERRTYGIVLVGVSVVMIVASIGGYFFRTESTARVSVSNPAALTDAIGAEWTLVSQGLSSFNALNRQVTAVGLEVLRENSSAGLLSAEIRQYLDVQGEPVFQPSPQPAVRSSLREDLYVVLREIGEDDSVQLSITINPLMSWLWIGAMVLVIGGVLATWPLSSGEQLHE